jgi:hypothetical protein
MTQVLGQARFIAAASFENLNVSVSRYLDFMDAYLAKGETCHPSDNLVRGAGGERVGRRHGSGVPYVPRRGTGFISVPTSGLLRRPSA